MILTFHVPCKMTGVLAGSRNPSTVRVRRRIEVPYQEVDPRRVELSITADQQYMNRVEHFYSLDGHGCYERLALDEVENRQERRLAHTILRLAPEGLYDTVLETVPAFRRLDYDGGPALDAAVSREASRCFFSGGDLYIPAAEPFYYLQLSDTLSYQLFSAGRCDNPNSAGYMHAFRLDEFDRLERFVGQCPNVPARLMQDIRHRLNPTIHVDGTLSFDPQRSRLVAIGSEVFSRVKGSVADLPVNEMIAWAEFRDFFGRWSRERFELSPLQDLADQVRRVLPVLRNHPKLTPAFLRTAEETLAAYPAVDVTAEDMAALDEPAYPTM